MADVILWGIHAGRTGDADALFFKRSVIAIGWKEMPNLSSIPATRDAFKAAYAKTYPDAKPAAIPNVAGQLFRFVHEIKKGDGIAYPSKVDRQIHLGQISGDYQHDPALDAEYPNSRQVQWITSVPRTRFSQGALYEIGSAMSLFQIKNYTDEFLSALEKQPISPQVEEDETIAEVAEDIEETTKDFILKTIAQELRAPNKKPLRNLLDLL